MIGQLFFVLANFALAPRPLFITFNNREVEDPVFHICRALVPGAIGTNLNNS
jgi:hypothetical protein